MGYERQYEIKEPKESLHWINHSTSQILKLLKELAPILAKIRDRLDKPASLTIKHAKPDEFGSKQEEIPF